MWELDIVLEGSLVRLEPLGPQHEDGLFDVARHAEIWESWPLDPATDQPTFHDWIESCLRAAAEGERRHYATIAAASGTPVGSTSYCTLRPEHRGIEIGWTWLTPAAWGTGANVEAKLLMLRHAFDVLGCQRVEFETDEQNARSRRALLALPSTFEGVHRDDKLVRGAERRSSAYYSVLDREWPAVRQNLERRLARHP